MVQNGVAILTLIIVGTVINLVIAFGVLRSLAALFGVTAETNTPRRSLLALVTIVPVAGVAGVPFFIVFPPFGIMFGTFVSAVVATIMFSDKFQVTYSQAAKIILPTVFTIFVVSGLVLYVGVPMI